MPRKPTERKSRRDISTAKLPCGKTVSENNSADDRSAETISLNSGDTLVAQDDSFPGAPRQGLQARGTQLRGMLGTDSLRISPNQAASLLDDSFHDSAHTRRDLLSGDVTIYAPNRGQRPNEFIGKGPFESEQTQDKVCESVAQYQSPILYQSPGLRGELKSSSSAETTSHDCPFCKGSENETPEAVWSGRTLSETNPLKPAYAIAAGEQEDWNVRVVPNKFPAVKQIADPKGEGETKTRGSSNFFPVEQVVGGHEVFIESSSHLMSLAEVDVADVYLLLSAYRDRINHYRNCPAVEYISIFKNNGSDAGASLSHTHSQLIATSMMPTRVRTILDRSRAHRAQTGSCLQCDLLRGELSERSRIVLTSGDLVAFCPFASRHAGMIRVVTKTHNAFFESQEDEQLHELAAMLKRLIELTERVFPGVSYNYLLHTNPLADKNRDAFHWSLDLFPRMTKTAGFEWSSDCNIHPMLPETTAAEFRSAAHESNPRSAADRR